jgi:hypothetical protein
VPGWMGARWVRKTEAAEDWGLACPSPVHTCGVHDRPKALPDWRPVRGVRSYGVV